MNLHEQVNIYIYKYIDIYNSCSSSKTTYVFEKNQVLGWGFTRLPLVFGYMVVGSGQQIASHAVRAVFFTNPNIPSKKSQGVGVFPLIHIHLR